MRRRVGTFRRVPPRAGALRASGDILVRPGTFDAVGDRIPVPVRARCPRLEQAAPGRVECPRRVVSGPGCHHLWTVRGLRALRPR